MSQLPEALGLSFSSTEDLNKIIDKKLPNGLPQFIREEVKLAGQKYEFYHCDILQCVQVLYSDPELAECLVYVPEKHYTGPDEKSQIFSEMNSGQWWWARQVGSHLNYSHLYYQSNCSSTERTQKRVSWYHDHPGHPLIGQNKSCALWDKDHLPGIHDYREHPKGYTAKTLTTNPHSCQLPSNNTATSCFQCCFTLPYAHKPFPPLFLPHSRSPKVCRENWG